VRRRTAIGGARVAARPMALEALADGRPVQLLPVFRITPFPYTVYWQTV
jgi:hypothetical protein